MIQYSIPFNNYLPVTPVTSHSPINKGIIIIPDISGYTKFVHNANPLEGRMITSQLLSSILEHNHLGMQIAEIEGDAVLFYKYGAPPSVNVILEQYESMLTGFREKLAELSHKLQKPLDLSLKLIAHYGEIAEYTIGGFTKLYGEPVIEAHRLLKNSINSGSYALLSDDLTQAIPADQQKQIPTGFSGSKLCEVYGDLRNICFTYFDYEHQMLKQMTA